MLFLRVSGQGNFYDPATIQKIEISFQQQNWDYMLDTAKAGKDGFIMASWVKINNTIFDSVGVKYKGNSSYNSTYNKNPIHIELDNYKEQDYQGFKDIKLSNAYADPSMIREVLAYEILRNYMPCPRSNFAQVYINGVYWGVYSNSESINKTFCAEHFYSGNGTLIKGNPSLTPSPNVKSNLRYISGDSSAYFNYYEMKSGYGWKDLVSLCDSVTNRPGNISSVMNLDRALWMLAYNNLLVNLDSYNGAFAQNYYLYKDGNGRFNPIIWDLNMCFGGFPFSGNSNTSLGTLSIAGQQNLPANVHANDQYWPLIKAVCSDATSYRKYMAHLKTIAQEFFVNGDYLTKYNAWKSTIDTAVLSDSKKFYSNTDFQNALNSNVSVGSYSVPGIQYLMSGRLSYLQATADFTNTAPSITGVVNDPATINQPVNISASITSASQVYLNYRHRSSEVFSRTGMFDDGLHNDGAANDNVYGGSFSMLGNNMQYYIYAENANCGTFSPARAEYEFHAIDLFPVPQAGQLAINEVLADNKSDVANEFHIKEDWIEIYNLSNSALSLSNVYLSDETNKRTKYVFPGNAVIQPKDFVIAWADEFAGGAQYHIGFKLDQDGETLVLSNGLNTIYDKITFGKQETDVSIARCPDGTGPFEADKLPSYKMMNCVVGNSENSISRAQLSVYPNPARDRVTVEVGSHEKQNLQLIDMMGITRLNLPIEHEATLNLAGMTPGIYFVNCAAQSIKLIIFN